MGKPIAASPEQYFCKYCQQSKSVEEMADGRAKRPSQSMCKSCRWKRQAQWKREHVGVFLVQLARHRSKKKNIPFDITADDIEVTEYCPILGIKLSKGKGKLHDFSATIDRINPELGYVPGNVIVISHRANRLKGNGTSEELRKVADWMDAQTAELKDDPKTDGEKLKAGWKRAWVTPLKVVRHRFVIDEDGELQTESWLEPVDAQKESA
jgi:hypothetical protein